MSRLGSSRLGRNISQFIKFGIVGGSGTLVNMASAVIAKKAAGIWGISEHDPLLNLFGTQFHIRWFHFFMMVAFLVANVWNYQLNRMWTFKAAHMRSWWRGFFPFLLTGLGAFLVSWVVATLLMNPTSPVALPADIFDDSTGFRTKFYWANAISIVVAMPVNFVINKLWAFRKPKMKIVAHTSPS